MDRSLTCKERIDDQFNSTIDDLRKLWEAYQNGEEEVEDLGSFWEYGLAFDYVPAGTFNDQDEGYFRYQLSWGGPSEEFRFFTDASLTLTKVQFWFLDWGDGAFIYPRGEDDDLMNDIWQCFCDIGSVEAELAKATA